MTIPTFCKFAASLVLATMLPSTSHAEAAVPQPGLAVHYYGEPKFFLHAGSIVVPNLALDIKANQLAWPPNNEDAAKGPVCHRGGGWSLVCRGALTVPIEGEYRFQVEGDEGMLFVDGLMAATDGSRSLLLKPGPHSIALYWKSTHWDGQATVRVKWQAPGQTTFEDVPASLLAHGVADASEELAWKPEIPLNRVVMSSFCQRLLPFEVPKDGLYEVAARMTENIPAKFELLLDGEHLLYIYAARYGAPAQRFDYLGRLRAVRFLKRGKHSATVLGHYSPEPYLDSLDRLLKAVDIGISPAKDDDLIGSLGIRVVDKNGQDRSDMVFRKGEPLIVSMVKNTGPAEQITVEVKEQRGDDQYLWSESAKFAESKKNAKAELRYPCDRQGAFEYVVKDGTGKILEGPWAFVVVDAAPIPIAKTGVPPPELKGIIVDKVDCALPGDAEHKLRDNGTSEVVDSPIGKYRVTGTSPFRLNGYMKDGTTWRRAKEGEKGVPRSAADWFAYTMKVEHPGKPHMLVAYVPNDLRRLVSIQAFDQVTGKYNAFNLEAGDAPEAGPFSKLSFLIWPNGPAIDVMTICSNENHGSKLNRQGAVAKIELVELPDPLPAMPSAVSGWDAQREVGWEGEQTNLGPVERSSPSLWKGNAPVPGTLPGGPINGMHYCDWRALLTAWERFGQNAAFHGDNLCMAPVWTYEMSLVQGIKTLPDAYDVYIGGYNSRVEDPMGRDTFKMMLLLAEKYHIKMVADLMIRRLQNGALEAFAKNHGCTNMDGILVSDMQGGEFKTISDTRLLNPAHPIARKYFLSVIDEIAARYGSIPSFAGIRIRQWTGWPSAMDAWYLNDKNGYDDFTVALFEKETGRKVGVDDTGKERFALRQKTLMGEAALRKAWLDWRCDKVQSLLEEAVVVMRRRAPDSKIYSGVIAGVPGIDANRGGGLDPEKLVGKREIGFGAHRKFGGEGVEWNQLDPLAFANFDIREPASVRFTMDKWSPGNGFNYPDGMCCDASFRSYPYQLEEPAKALANNRLEMFTYSPAWCLPPIDEGFRRFVQVFRTIPMLAYERFSGSGSEQTLFSCWSAVRPRKGAGSETIFYVVNQTAKSRIVKINFGDRVKDVGNLVDGKRIPAANGVVSISLAPFMPAVFGVEGKAPIQAVNVDVSETEMAELQKKMESFQAIRKRAGTVRHVFTLAAGKNDFGWERNVDEIFDDNGAPILAAWQAGQPVQASYLLDRMIADRTWWFEAFGWPVGTEPSRTAVGVLKRADELNKKLKIEGESRVAAIAPFKGKLLLIPSGKATWNMGASGGVYEFRIWGLMGGGYGPINVLVDGKEAGRIGVVTDQPNNLRHVLPVTLCLPAGGHLISLIAEGNSGLALSAMEMTLCPPMPIKKWSVLGVFDKGTNRQDSRLDGGEGLDKVFPPEKGIAVTAAYAGLDGKEIRWRQVDMGNAPFLNLREVVFPNSPASAVAYLASWVKSPTDRDAVLFYAMDWFGKIWVNDQLVLPKITGPSSAFAKQQIHLKAGWNLLLVKTSPGTANWMANLAVSNPGDLTFSPVPPEPSM